jgi:hypothetical protein
MYVCAFLHPHYASGDPRRRNDAAVAARGRATGAAAEGEGLADCGGGGLERLRAELARGEELVVQPLVHQHLVASICHEWWWWWWWR